MAAEGGFEVESEKTRLVEKTKGDDEDERANETTEFQPGASSPPDQNENQRQTTLNRIGDLPDTPGLSTTAFAESVIDEVFAKPKKIDIKYRVYNDKVEVASIDSKAQNPYKRLFTEIRGRQGEYHINPQIKGTLLKALGKTKIQVFEEQEQKLTEGINENKALAADTSLSQNERDIARERAQRQINHRSDVRRQRENLIKKFFTPFSYSESFELNTFQKNEESRNEKLRDIQKQKEENNKTINDKNSSPEQVESAMQSNQELDNQENEIENQRNRETENLPLRERLREKVKAIFKKYGFTVGSVLLAVGTTLGVVLSSLSNGLKGVAKGVGNGLRTLGKKIAGILPGLLGAVVSFVFRTAGNVISFLGKHAWVLILAVAAFLFERVMKRRG